VLLNSAPRLAKNRYSAFKTTTNMKKTTIILAILTILFGCGTSTTKENTQAVSGAAESQVIIPLKANNKNIEMQRDIDTLSLVVDNIFFEIRPDGILRWGNNLADTLRLTTDMYVNLAYFHKVDNILFLFIEESDSEDGTSEILKIDLSQKTIIWKTGLNGFNLGDPYLINGYAYLTAIGVVGKLNLETGKYTYHFPDLYEKGSFNFFDTIIFKDSLTYFLSNNSGTKRNDTVVVNETTGKITIKK